ncbi:ly6/PLAUR domain-containing protein 6B-like [Tachypleus tridentatus]|uniref:ly6/PLAUR domain-containing protein 6B-like n=1 Tax=Tachypleus tridentatus TaxID=6853 RepID=UPI003FD3F75E
MNILNTILSVWWFSFFIAPIQDVGSVSHEITCYTCSNKTTNFDCNRYAVDRPCFPDQTFCYTEHIMDEYGETILLSKTCATKEQCNHKTVGCYFSGNDPINMKCISCCDIPYCNRKIPTNETSAILLLKRQNSNKGFQTVFHWTGIFLYIKLWVILICI